MYGSQLFRPLASLMTTIPNKMIIIILISQLENASWISWGANKFYVHPYEENWPLHGGQAIILVKDNRLKVRLIFLAYQTWQTQLVVSFGWIVCCPKKPAAYIFSLKSLSTFNVSKWLPKYFSTIMLAESSSPHNLCNSFRF